MASWRLIDLSLNAQRWRGIHFRMQTRFLLAALILVLSGVRVARAADDPKSSHDAVEGLKAYLKAEPIGRPAIDKQPFSSVPLSREDAATAEKLLWDDHVRHIRTERAEEMKAKVLREGKLEMPFAYTLFGKKPKSGRSLYISLHGGGNAAKAVNDSQWENQKRLYRPEEGVYLAPRAPTNTWNLWHEAHIDRLFNRLIENLIVFEDVDPNRVYIMGYSAGGDGVYQLAPRMADRWAAAAMMAGHPNDASPLGLRNLPFTIHVGALDGAYKRNMIAGEWGEKLDLLQKEDAGGYVHWVHVHEGKAHWMDRDDAEAVPWMAKYTRDPLPKRIVWMQDDVTHSRFYWLAVEEKHEKAGARVIAEWRGQTISLESAGVSNGVVFLNDQMIDLDQRIDIKVNGKPVFAGRLSRTVGVLNKTLQERGDPSAVYSAEITWSAKPSE